MMNVDTLLEESKQTFSGISRSLSDGRPDKAAVVKGATQAAMVCVLSEGALSEALDLVRRFCSVHVVGLKAVASVIDSESEKIGRGEPGDGGSGSDRAVRLLRVLISALNSFLGKGRSSAHSSGKHLDVLEGTVAVMRRTIDNLTGEFVDTTAGKAAARLRGLTAMACFGRRRSSRHDQAKETKWNENLARMGTRDVEKLLKCLSRQSKKDHSSSYLRNPGSCVEALGALRRVATAVPEVYPKIATAFADAVRCMDGASEGEWGRRPSLMNETVRHTLVACSAHLADRVGRAPDEARREAFHALCGALSDCCIMQTGGYLPDMTPSPDSAAGRALRGKASTNRNPARAPDNRDGKVAETDHRGAGANRTPAEASMIPVNKKIAPISPRAGAGASGTPAEASMTPDDKKNASTSPRAGAGANGTPAEASMIPVDKKIAPISPRAGAGASGTPAEASMTAVDKKNASTSPRAGAGVSETPVKASMTTVGNPPPTISSQAGAGANETPAEASMTPVDKKNASTLPRAEAGASGTPVKASTTTVGKIPPPISSRAGAGASGTPVKASTTTVGKTSPPISPRTGAGANRTPAEASMIPVNKKIAPISPRAGAGASGTPAEASMTPVDRKTEPIPPRVEGKSGTPPESFMAPVDWSETAAPLVIVTLSANPWGNAGKGDESSVAKATAAEALVAAPAAKVAIPAEARSTDPQKRPCTSPEGSDERQAPVVAAPASSSMPAPPSVPARTSAPTRSPGAHPSSNGHSSNRVMGTAIPTAAPPAPATAVSPTTEDCRREKKGLAPAAVPAASQAPVAPLEINSVHPSTETKPRGGDGDGDEGGDTSIDWKEGERYDVVLGKSFYRDAGRKDDGSGQYVHLKYDFVPGRTNLDAPSTLRQGPLTGADGQANSHGQQRWAAEMVYESKDPENPWPVRFDGDAARAQDVECVLVFDGSTFVMERVSVVGGLKNVQEFSGPAVRSAGGATLEASMARRKKKEARPKKEQKDPKEKDEHQKQQQQLQKKRNDTVEGGKRNMAGSGAEAGAGDKGKLNGSGGSGTSVIEKKGRKEKKAGIGITINPANMLSQPKSRKTGGDSSPPELNGDSNNGNGASEGVGVG